MKKISNKFKIILTGIILLIISLVFIIVNGNTYIIKIDNMNKIRSIEDLNIE